MPAKTTTAVDMRYNLGLSTPSSTDATNPYFTLLSSYDATGSPPISNTAYGYAQAITMYGADGSTQQATIYFDAASSSQPDSVVKYLIASGDTAKDGTATAGTGALMTGTLTFDSTGQLKDMTAFTPAVAGSTMPSASWSGVRQIQRTPWSSCAGWWRM